MQVKSTFATIILYCCPPFCSAVSFPVRKKMNMYRGIIYSSLYTMGCLNVTKRCEERNRCYTQHELYKSKTSFTCHLRPNISHIVSTIGVAELVTNGKLQVYIANRKKINVCCFANLIILLHCRTKVVSFMYNRTPDKHI